MPTHQSRRKESTPCARLTATGNHDLILHDDRRSASATGERRMGALMGMEGGRADRRRSAAAARVRGARRPLHDAHALHEQHLGRFVDRQRGPQQPHRLSAGRGYHAPRDEPARRDGRHLHVADKTFYDAIETTTAPMIASHSYSHIIANHARNMTDDMMRALARNGGVVVINYHAAFLGEEFRVASEKTNGNVLGAGSAVSKKCGGNEACAATEGERIDHEAMLKGDPPTVVEWEEIHRAHRPRCGDHQRGWRSRRPLIPTSTAPRCRWVWKTRRNCRRSPTRC